jgi:hypothetical protein
MIEILALSISLLVKNPMDALPFLPEDLCVDFTDLKPAFDPECPEYYIVNPETGSFSPAPLPIPISYEFAVMTNEVLRRGLIHLKRKSPSN